MLLRSFAFAAAAILSSIGVQAAYSSDGPNVMYYWGQDSADGKNTQSSLATYCKSGLADAYLISFLNKFNIGGLPGMNLAGTCETKFDGTKLLDCPDVGEDIKTCQSLGIKIILSLGGDEGSYGFKSDSEAETFAETIWDLFGGGSSDTRPFGDAQIDGIDLDIEGGASTGYATFVTSLRSKFDSDFIIGAAPQCPFPDAVLGSVIDEVGFDYVNVQFYNNYCSAAGSSFNFDTWAEWAAKTSPNSNTKVYFTTPGSKTAAGTGYTGISTIETVVPTLASSYSGIYGGVSVWDVSEAWRNDDFVSDLYSIVHSSSGSGGSSKTTTAKHLTTTSTKHTSTKTTSTKKSTTTKKTSTKKTSTKKSSTRKSSTKKSSTKKSHTKKTHTKKTHTKKSHTKTKHTRSTHTKSTHTKSTHTKSTHTKTTHTKTTHTKTTHTKTTHTKTTHTKTTSTATATATSGTCVTSGQSCPTQNQMICTTGGKYAVCDHSKWTIMPCPNGTTCIPTANGSSMYCGYSTGAANTCPVLTARSHLHNTLNRGGAVPKPYSVSNVNTQLVVDTATDTEFSAIINARKTITSPFKDSVTIQFTAPKNIKFTHATGGTVRQNGNKVRINLKQSFNESMAFVVDVKGIINSGVFVAPNPSSLRIK